MVPTVTEDNLTRQLTGIQQVVNSRSSLEPLVEKYDLYKIERLRGEPIEGVISMMRKDIDVKVNTTATTSPTVSTSATGTAMPRPRKRLLPSSPENTSVSKQLTR